MSKRILRRMLLITSGITIVMTIFVWFMTDAVTALSFASGAALVVTLAFLTGEALDVVLIRSSRIRAFGLFGVKVLLAAIFIVAVLKLHGNFAAMAVGTVIVVISLAIMLMFVNQTRKEQSK